ncbi:MAG: hypothetical protein JXA94_06880 [Parachlamydiales bacterium]|nr:hypothetical protein [Parachlamydiales bacterium]
MIKNQKPIQVFFFHFFLCFSVLILVSILALYRTQGFATFKIKKFAKVEKKWSFEKPQDIDEIKKILSQDFEYLSRGRQAFVFVSSDKKYVLKFADKERFNLFYYFPKIPLPKVLNNYRNKHYYRRKNRFENDLQSLKLAYENLKEDAALKYVHINKTNIFKNIKIKNKIGKSFQLDINDKIFVLQKKYDENFFDAYEKSKDLKKDLLLSFLDMVDRRNKKFIIDDDIGKKRRNWAIINQSVVNIDVGRWYFDEKLILPQVYKKEMLKATKTLRLYLLENDKSMLGFVEKTMNKYISNYEENYFKKNAKTTFDTSSNLHFSSNG